MGTRTPLVLQFAVVAAGITAIAAGFVATPAAEDVVWLNELENNPKLIGKEVVVEGWYSARVGQNRDQLNLKNSKVEFRVSPEQADRLPSVGRFVRLTGTLSQSEGKVIMRVKAVAPTSATDTDRYEDATRNLGPKDFQGWYDLAERTRRLAEFHSNNDLKARGRQAMQKGFQVEESLVKPAQFEDLLVLANRVESAGFEDEGRRMRHKALRRRFEALAAANTPAQDWDNLAAQIAKFLPGAQAPLKPADSVLVSRYANARNPNDLYDSRVSERDAFDREFWIAVITRRLLAESEKPSADLVRLSDQAKQLLPDRPEVGQQLLSRWAEAEAHKFVSHWSDAKAQKLAPVKDSQVLNLAKTFRIELGKPERADALIRQWLEVKRSKLGRDAEGRYQLAHLYRLELQDASTAVELVTEALKIDPDPVRQHELDELTALGFTKGPRGWGRSDPGSGPTTTQPIAAREGLPEPNKTTADQVRKMYSDPRPNDVLRVGTAGQVVEQWILRGPVDMYVTFRLSRSSPAVVSSTHTQKK